MFARSGETGWNRPSVVIAHSRSAYIHAVERAFRRHGWGFLRAADGPQARRLIAAYQPRLVILEAEFPGESGWLTCAKLSLADAETPAILVGDGAGEWEQDFADFVGAVRLVAAAEGVEPLLEEAGLVAVASG